MKISLATESDKADIFTLYKMQIGREFCPWNDNYPTMDNIEFDLSLDSLFVMRDDENKIIAAISIDHDEEVDKLECWSSDLQPSGELSRIAVDIRYQNQGVARKMIEYAMIILKERGYKSIHMLVNKLNKKALASYNKLFFNVVGECFMYDQSFWCYEKELL